MKILALLLGLFSSISVSFANDGLEASMEIIGEQFKIVGQAVQTQAVSQDHLAAIELMQKEIAKSSLIFPDKASSDSEKLQYSVWMAELMQMALNLEELVEQALAANNGDLSLVIQEFVKMNELRKEAHDVFKE